MAIEGKKINELTQISAVSNETVLPAVYVNGSTTASTANKISMQQISNKVQDDMSTILANKQDKLTAGENITIVNNVISATGSVDENKIIVKSSTIPTASGELLGKIYCYSGETNATYTHGYIYECVGTTDNATWQRIDVQPGGTSEQAITTISSTSGSISLETNKVYKVTLNGNTTFVLPNTVDNTKFNQIYLQINLTNNSNINFGTSNYFTVQPTLEIGENRITYEYDANEQVWYVGKIGGKIGTVAETTWFNGVNGTTLNTGITGANVRIFKNGLLVQPGQSITARFYKGGSGKSLVLAQTAPLSTADTWSIKTRIKWVSDGNPTNPIVYAYSGTTDNQAPCFGTAGDNHLGMWISSDGSSWDIDDAYYSQLVPQNDVTYDFETKFTGTNYQFLYSTDSGRTWTVVRDVQNSAKVYCVSPFRFLNNALAGNYYNNSVLDMSRTKIVVDGQTWFDGATAVEGTDYTNDGCTLTEVPSSTNDYYYNPTTGVITFSEEIVNGTVAVEYYKL